ncbi:hypothetical protein PR202_gb08279 [Eleusine coracana subsp. coracana]|uniref:Uncharacterized protein n=1 Tax=Eleusine coracana subsp. coracana TaxID=191504 RepID=A0AAV5EEJ0_ELECO|nr:hypothetical protein PR202_gb08279 [Eleusine coracana subsp. coracana]
MWAGDKSVTGAQCLVAWDAVTRPKDHGGLGIRDLGIQNSCLLLKLIHCLHTAEDSSWARWVRGHIDISSLTGDLDGAHWNDLRRLLLVYQAITIVEIGDGRSTAFWDDQ